MLFSILITVACWNFVLTYPLKKGKGQECWKEADLVFVLDASDSIDPPRFRQELDFVTSVVEHFGTSHDGIHAGVVIYSKNIIVPVTLGRVKSIQDLRNSLYKVEQEQHGTYTSRGIFAMLDLFALHGRRDVPYIGIVVTDGRSKNSVYTAGNATEAKNRGIHMFSVGVGRKISQKELTAIASGPRSQINVNDFNQLYSVAGSIASSMCATPPTPSITTIRPQRTCYQDADIIFLLDASDSILPYQFKQELEFVIRATEGFLRINPDVRVGVVIYSKAVIVPVQLGRAESVGRLIELLGSVVQEQHGTHTSLGLSKMLEQFQKYGRKNVQYIGIVVTDGKSKRPTITANNAGKLKRSRVEMFAVGVGRKVMVPELQAIASGNGNVLFVQDFKRLLNNAHLFENLICPAPPTTTAMTRITSPNACYWDADVIFLLDASDSIYPDQFKQELGFVIRVTERFLYANPNVQIGVVIYSKTVIVPVPLQKVTSIVQIRQLLDAVDQEQHGTHTSLGLATMLGQFQKYGRKNVQYIGVVITDGKSKRPEVTSANAARLKQHGVDMFAVGIGRRVLMTELVSISSRPGNVIFVRDFQKLHQRANVFENLICKSTTTLPVVTPTKVPATTTDIVTPSKPSSACYWDADVIFLLDASVSILPSQFKQQLEFVIRVSGRFLQANPNVRIGVILFSKSIMVPIQLGKANNIDEIEQVLKGVVQEKHAYGTHTSLGLALMLEQYRQYGRRNVQLIGVVITDGKSRWPLITVANAAKLKKYGVDMYAVGVGQNVVVTELKSIASNQRNVISVYDFQMLYRSANVFEDLICKSTTTIPTVTTTKEPATTTTTTTLSTVTPTKGPVCWKDYDAIFVLDASDSILPHEFQQQLDFVIKVAEGLRVADPAIRVGVVIYSKQVVVPVRLGEAKDIAKLKDLLRAVVQEQHGTHTSQGIAVMLQQFMMYGRPGVPYIGIVITDGQSKRPDLTAANSAKAQQQGIHMYSVGVGRKVNINELLAIASAMEYVIYVRDFRQLLHSADGIGKLVCETPETTTEPISTSTTIIVDSTPDTWSSTTQQADSTTDQKEITTTSKIDSHSSTTQIADSTSDSVKTTTPRVDTTPDSVQSSTTQGVESTTDSGKPTTTSGVDTTPDSVQSSTTQGVDSTTDSGRTTTTSGVDTTSDSAQSSTTYGVDSTTDSGRTTTTSGVDTTPDSAQSSTTQGVDSTPDSGRTTTTSGVDTTPDSARPSTTQGVDSTTDSGRTTTTSGVDTTPDSVRSSTTQGVDSTTDSGRTTTTSGVDTTPDSARSSTTHGVDSTTDSGRTTTTSGVDTTPDSVRSSTTQGVDSTTDSGRTTTTSGVDTTPDSVRSSTTQGVDSTTDPGRTTTTSGVDTTPDSVRSSTTQGVDSTTDSGRTTTTSGVDSTPDSARSSTTQGVDPTTDSGRTPSQSTQSGYTDGSQTTTDEIGQAEVTTEKSQTTTDGHGQGEVTTGRSQTTTAGHGQGEVTTGKSQTTTDGHGQGEVTTRRSQTTTDGHGQGEVTTRRSQTTTDRRGQGEITTRRSRTTTDGHGQGEVTTRRSQTTTDGHGQGEVTTRRSQTTTDRHGQGEVTTRRSQTTTDGHGQGEVTTRRSQTTTDGHGQGEVTTRRSQTTTGEHGQGEVTTQRSQTTTDGHGQGEVTTGRSQTTTDGHGQGKGTTRRSQTTTDGHGQGEVTTRRSQTTTNGHGQGEVTTGRSQTTTDRHGQGEVTTRRSQTTTDGHGQGEVTTRRSQTTTDGHGQGEVTTRRSQTTTDGHGQGEVTTRRSQTTTDEIGQAEVTTKGSTIAPPTSVPTQPELCVPMVQQLFDVPGSCRQFWMCVQGIRHYRCCPEGYAFYVGFGCYYDFSQSCTDSCTGPVYRGLESDGITPLGGGSAEEHDAETADGESNINTDTIVGGPGSNEVDTNQVGVGGASMGAAESGNIQGNIEGGAGVSKSSESSEERNMGGAFVQTDQQNTQQGEDGFSQTEGGTLQQDSSSDESHTEHNANFIQGEITNEIQSVQLPPGQGSSSSEESFIDNAAHSILSGLTGFVQGTEAQVGEDSSEESYTENNVNSIQDGMSNIVQDVTGEGLTGLINTINGHAKTNIGIGNNHQEDSSEEVNVQPQGYDVNGNTANTNGLNSWWYQNPYNWWNQNSNSWWSNPNTAGADQQNWWSGMSNNGLQGSSSEEDGYHTKNNYWNMFEGYDD